MDKNNKKYKKDWYLKNRDKAIAYTILWQKENKEKVNANHREYYKENKERIKLRTKEWQRKNPDKKRVYARRWNAQVTIKRNDFRNHLRESMGNQCSGCGYKEEPRILHFHHLRDKRFSLGSYRRYSLRILEDEAKKCILLCPNCHAIKHLK